MCSRHRLLPLSISLSFSLYNIHVHEWQYPLVQSRILFVCHNLVGHSCVLQLAIESHSSFINDLQTSYPYEYSFPEQHVSHWQTQGCACLRTGKLAIEWKIIGQSMPIRLLMSTIVNQWNRDIYAFVLCQAVVKRHTADQIKCAQETPISCSQMCKHKVECKLNQSMISRFSCPFSQSVMVFAWLHHLFRMYRITNVCCFH